MQIRLGSYVLIAVNCEQTPMLNLRSAQLLILLSLCLLAPLDQAVADKFTLDAVGGGTVELEARLVGSGQNLHALESASGRILLVKESSVKIRVRQAGPKSISGKAMASELTEMFGRDRFRVLVGKPFVIGLVLATPINDKKKEVRVKALLQKSQRFMNNVQSVFLKFTRSNHVKAKPIRFPLVVLIFETDRLFEVYARKIMGERGLAVVNVAGFYDALTNYLVLRMSECTTFDTPLHEAIHQQVYNRQILQRMAPIPVWFNEGIATGFEGDGERVTGGAASIEFPVCEVGVAVTQSQLERNRQE